MRPLKFRYDKCQCCNKETPTAQWQTGEPSVKVELCSSCEQEYGNDPNTTIKVNTLMGVS